MWVFKNLELQRKANGNALQPVEKIGAGKEI